MEGHIQTGSYTNKDGVKVYTSDVVAENMEFAEIKAKLEAADTNSRNDLLEFYRQDERSGVQN